MKILVTQQFEYIVINNIISIQVVKTDEVTEDMLQYWLVSKDINGKEMDLGVYRNEFDANLVLTDIMYWIADDDAAMYSLPMFEDFDTDKDNEMFQPVYTGTTLLSKLYTNTRNGTECIKAQNGTLILMNNIKYLRSYILSGSPNEFLTISDQEEMRKEYSLSPEINSIIIAENVRGEQMLIGQFKDEDEADNTLDDLYMRRILYIDTDNK